MALTNNSLKVHQTRCVVHYVYLSVFDGAVKIHLNLFCYAEYDQILLNLY